MIEFLLVSFPFGFFFSSFLAEILLVRAGRLLPSEAQAWERRPALLLPACASMAANGGGGATDVLMEGPLQKLPKQKPKPNNLYSVAPRSSLQSRWFTLNGAGQLNYFTEMSRKQHKGVVIIASDSSVRLLSRQEADTGKAFLIDSSESGIIIMEAASPEVANTWVQAVSGVIERLRGGGSGGGSGAVSAAAQASASQEAMISRLRGQLRDADKQRDDELAAQDAKHEAELAAVRAEGSAALEKLREKELELERRLQESGEQAQQLASTAARLEEEAAARASAERALKTSREEWEKQREQSDAELRELRQRAEQQAAAVEAQKALNGELCVRAQCVQCLGLRACVRACVSGVLRNAEFGPCCALRSSPPFGSLSGLARNRSRVRVCGVRARVPACVACVCVCVLAWHACVGRRRVRVPQAPEAG